MVSKLSAILPLSELHGLAERLHRVGGFHDVPLPARLNKRY
jgi:hypothetical protein